MVMDRHNRSHKPKGTPDGGRYEAKNGSAGSDDVTPPMDADPTARIIGSHEPLTGMTSSTFAPPPAPTRSA